MSIYVSDRIYTTKEVIERLNEAARPARERKERESAEIAAYHNHWRTRLSVWLRDVVDAIEPQKPKALIDLES